jgi:hypothetical protein
MNRTIVRRALAAVVALAASGTAWAQPATEDVEVEPLTCWWRASSGSVHVGEPFSLVLTCAVVETASTRVVPDQSRLDPAVVQLPPFEVLGGSRAGDLRTTGQRFLQYSYRARLLAEEAFARDVAIPSLEVSYRVETRTGQGSSSLGREQSYTLPPLAMRIASLVPNDAADIREVPAMTLADIDASTFKARTLRIAAIGLFTLGALVLMTAVVRMARRGRTPAGERRELEEAAILRGARNELVDAQRRARQEGWTPDVAARALAALRIVGSAALGRPLSQRTAREGPPAGEGELLLRGRWPGSAAIVSGSATAVSVADTLSHRNGTDPLLSELAEGLSRLTASRYGRDGVSSDAAEVDGALESGARLASRLASDRGWVAQQRAELKRAASRWRSRVWAS